MIADEPLTQERSPAFPSDVYVVGIRPPKDSPLSPHFPMHIEINNTFLTKEARATPEEITPADGMMIHYGILSGGDKFMMWAPHDGDAMLTCLMSPNKEYEKVQYRAFVRLCWQLSELRRLGHINFTAPPPFDGPGEMR